MYICLLEISKHGLDAWDLIRFRCPTPEELTVPTVKDLPAACEGGQPKEPEIILDCHYDHWRCPEVGVRNISACAHANM